MDLNDNTKKSEKQNDAVLLASAAAVPRSSEFIGKKSPGETRIVALVGDYWHNAVWQEIQLRDIFASETNWRMIFVRYNRFFTPEIIKDADLLITSRSSAPERIGWNPDGMADTVEQGEIMWRDENVDAVVDSVRNRGMGLLALHCASYSRNSTIADLIGVEPIMHNQVQPVWVHDLNKEHPITKDIGNFFISLDEQFAAVIKSQYTTSLFSTTSIHDKRQAVGGWCKENGKGRIVGLLPGHMAFPYSVPEYREIIRRSAFWAMNREIPSPNGVE